MGLDKKDFEMMSVSIPIVDWFDVRDQIDRLNGDVNRLEKIVEALAEIYQKERVKSWEIILNKMIEREDRKAKGNPKNEFASRRRET
jgi:hypothetical protein